MITLDATIVNVALGPIVSEPRRHACPAAQWIVNGYTLAFAALLLSAGALWPTASAPAAGFLIGLAIFGLGSAALQRRRSPCRHADRARASCRAPAPHG